MTIAWEYMTLALKIEGDHDAKAAAVQHIDVTLNKAGAQGREVCGFAVTNIIDGWQCLYTLKRQKQGQ